MARDGLRKTALAAGAACCPLRRCSASPPGPRGRIPSRTAPHGPGAVRPPGAARCPPPIPAQRRGGLEAVPVPLGAVRPGKGRGRRVGLGTARLDSARLGSVRHGSARLSHRAAGPLGLSRVGLGRRWAAGSGAAACCIRKRSWCRRTASGFIFQECESFPLASRRELKFNSSGAAPPNPCPGPSFASRTPRPWDPCPWVPCLRIVLVHGPCLSVCPLTGGSLRCRSCCWCVAIINTLRPPSIPTSMHSLIDPIAFGLHLPVGPITRVLHSPVGPITRGSSCPRVRSLFIVHSLHSPVGPVARG